MDDNGMGANSVEMYVQHFGSYKTFGTERTRSTFEYRNKLDRYEKPKEVLWKLQNTITVYFFRKYGHNDEQNLIYKNVKESIFI